MMCASSKASASSSGAGPVIGKLAGSLGPASVNFQAGVRLDSPKVPALRCDVAKALADSQEEDGLSEAFLQHYCETDELGTVTQLEIQADAVTQSIESLGTLLPNLRQLRLTESSIATLRDLGTSLEKLEVLWMSRCGLQDLGGVAAMPALREFYLPFNDVTDLAPLSEVEHLEVLDIEGNAVESWREVGVLSLCSNLRELTLTGNPVCRAAGYSREAVLELLPRLFVLDDELVQAEAGGMADEAAKRSWLLQCDPQLHAEVEAELALYLPRGVVEVEDIEDDIDSDEEDTLSEESDGSSAGQEERLARNGAAPQLAEKAGASELKPLNPLNRLLAERLKDVATNEDARALYAAEPDEDELVVEQLKRARRKPVLMHAFTARPAPSYSSSFNFQSAPERQSKTADPETAFRPPSAAHGLRYNDLKLMNGDTASDLTRGDSLAGSPLAAARQRQRVSEEIPDPRVSEAGMDIRDLLRRYQTFTQESCLPPGELRDRKREADQRRPSTPDVRVRSTPSPTQEWSALAANRIPSRPGSRSGMKLTSGGLGAPRGHRVSSISEMPVLDGDEEVPRIGAARRSSEADPQTVVSPTLRTRFGETLILDAEPVS